MRAPKQRANFAPKVSDFCGQLATQEYDVVGLTVGPTCLMPSPVLKMNITSGGWASICAFTVRLPRNHTLMLTVAFPSACL